MTINITPMTDEEWTKIPTDKESGYGAVQTSQGNLPLKKMEIHSTIVGLSATTNILQCFKNNFRNALEVTYIFPLPPGGAVQNLRIKIAGREIIGQLKERGEARAEYAQAISDGHRASIVEEERPDIFTLRAGNIAPGETMEVIFDLVELLPLSDSEVTFRFPLVVAPKYIPGAPLDGENVGKGVSPDTDIVPDGSRISPPTLLPGRTNHVELSIALTVEGGGFSLRHFKSSLPTKVSTEGGLVKIEVIPGERLNRDFILRFDLGKDDIKTQLLVSPDEKGEGGTFALTLVPPAASDSVPRDVVFVLDRSGSMGGWKMVAARRAIGRMVDSLTDKDRFSVLAFDTSIEHFLGDDLLIDATNRNRFRAVEWLAKIDSRGGTEILAPLEGATLMLNERNMKVFEGRLKTIVLVTDGQVGNESEIITRMTNTIADIRLHTIGIDEAVSAAFLQGLAKVGNGVCELVESEDRLDDAMDRIHRNIGSAALTDIDLSFEGLEVDKKSLPTRFPDAYEGIATLILGRFTKHNNPSLELVGKNAKGEAMKLKIKGKVHRSAALGAIWARRHIRKLDDQYAANMWDGNQDDIEKEMIETSIKFGILSRFTAFVAVDRDAKIDTNSQIKVVQPVESPAGWVGSANMPVPMSPAPSRRASSFGAGAPPAPQSVGAPGTRARLSKKRAVPASAPMDYMAMEPVAMSMDKGMMTLEEGYFIENLTRIQILAAWLFEALSNQVYDFDAGVEKFDHVNLGILHDVLERALDEDPSVQFASMNEFLRTLLDQKKVSYFFDKPVSLKTLFEGSDVDAKVAAMYYLAGTPLDQISDSEFSKENIWFKGKEVSFGAPVEKKKPFWKR